jgi:hypothetical protein
LKAEVENQSVRFEILMRSITELTGNDNEVSE